MISIEPPEGFAPKFDVVGCFVESDGCILLLHRNPTKFEGNKWGKPAGKIDAGETPLQAMCRELREETGIEAREEDMETLESVSVRHLETDLVYHMFRLRPSERPDVLLSETEHQAFQWIAPLDALALSLIHDLDACIRLYYR